MRPTMQPPHSALEYLAILSLAVLSVFPSADGLSCHACTGPSCAYGECSGTVCFAGLSPLGPHSLSPFGAPVIKGCLSGFQNDTESIVNQSTIVFGADALDTGAVVLCSSGDFCNRRKFDKKALEKQVGKAASKTVCRVENPLADSVDDMDVYDICVAEWCWSAQVPLLPPMFEPKPPRTRRDIRLRGCSSLALGLPSHSGVSFCISPPITDALLTGGAPLLSLGRNNSVACYCRSGPLCNSDMRSLDDIAPLMYVTVILETPGNVAASADAYVWVLGDAAGSDEDGVGGMLVPGVTGYIGLEGPGGFKLAFDTQLTAAGARVAEQQAAKEQEGDEGGEESSSEGADSSVGSWETKGEEKEEEEEENKIIVMTEEEYLAAANDSESKGWEVVSRDADGRITIKAASQRAAAIDRLCWELLVAMVILMLFTTS